MSGDKPPLRIDKDRIGEPERSDRGSDLGDLLFGMGPRVARIRKQRARRPIGHPEGTINRQISVFNHIKAIIERTLLDQSSSCDRIDSKPKGNLERPALRSHDWTVPGNGALLSCPHVGLVAVAEQGILPCSPGRTTMTKQVSQQRARHTTAPTPAPTKPATKALSRPDQIEAMLRRRTGASIAEIMAATGWQPHSVRGALAGALKQRGLVITSGQGRGCAALPGKNAMSSDEAFTAYIDGLERLELEDLRQLWSQHYGVPPSLRSVPILRLLLAWRLQADRGGGLDSHTRRALARKGRERPEGLDLGVGARLKRRWQGREVEVVVMADGFY